MRKELCAFALAIAAAGLFAEPARAVLINFDTDPDGNPIVTGTNINTTYSSLGVTLGCFNGTDSASNLCSGNAYANATASAASSPNVISLTPGTPLGLFIDERFGFFRASFATPVSSVSIDAMPVPLPEGLGTRSDAPFLQAFGAGGTFLGQAVYSGIASCDPTVANSCPYQTLTFTRPTEDILFVAFSSSHVSGPTTFGMFDNLVFTRQVLGPGNGVPEPMSLALLALGLAALGLTRRKVARS